MKEIELYQIKDVIFDPHKVSYIVQDTDEDGEPMIAMSFDNGKWVKIYNMTLEQFKEQALPIKGVKYANSRI